MADIQGNYRVTYLDGREETTTVSVGNRIQAEIQARRGKCGNLQESAYRQLSYSVWHSLKRDHKTELEFNDWTFTVDDIEQTLREAVAHGGEQIGEIERMGEDARWVYLRDTEGNVVGLYDER